MNLRIAFVDNDLSKRTGSRRFTYEVARQLENMGHKVKIFTTRMNKQRCFEGFLSLPVETLSEKQSLSSETFRNTLARCRKNCVLDLASILYYNLKQANFAMSISKKILEADVDAAVFHYHGEHWLLPFFYFLGESKGVLYLNMLPPFPRPRALPFQEMSTARRIADGFLDLPPIGKWKKSSFRKLAMVLTPSSFLLQQVKSHGIIDQQKSAVVPLGVNHSEFYPTGEDENFALYLGRIHPHKSLELAILAMKKTRQHYSLVIAGDINEDNLWYKDKLIALAEKAQLSDRVKIVLHPSDSEVVRLMQKCSVFLFPSTIDTFGLVVLEAMACGKPVVACNRGGVPEIVGKAGFLIEPDKTQWQTAVSQLLGDSALRQEMGKKALERAYGFSWEKTANNLVHALNSLAN